MDFRSSSWHKSGRSFSRAMVDEETAMESERESKEHVVFIPGLAQRAESFDLVWGRGNKITAYASGRPKNRGHRASQTTQDVNPISEVCWETSLYNPEVRKLVTETRGIFVTLQRAMESLDGSSAKAFMVKISRMYRSVIDECFRNLQAAADASPDPELQATLEIQSQIFYKMKLIWSLCEILFIDIQHGGALIHQLLEWIKWHFPECEKRAQKALESENNVETHSDYWDAVHGYLLQGRIEDTRKLLRHHSDFQSESFLNLDELLRKMPIYGFNSNQSLAEFELRWQLWQDECRRRYAEGEFAANRSLETACRILCGEREVFEEVASLCETWYHLLVSKLLYTNPSVKGFEIHYAAEESIDMFGGSKQMGPLDNILLSVLQFDITQIIKESSSYFDSWWFVAHLTDLLDHSKQLNSQTKSYATTLRESLILDYASCLMSHHSLWQTAVDYLEYCPIYGRQYLETFLERIPVDTEWKAKKVLNIAQKYDLQDLVRSICKIVGMQALQNGCLGSALTWALKSKDSLLATYLADKFLQDYCEEGQFSSLDLLDNLGSSVLISDRLTFLGKYREFHKLYGEREFKTAATVLVSLLTSRVAPKRFWMNLLLDALPLLESAEIIFSSEQTYELLYCLEELDKFSSDSSEKSKAKSDSVCEKEELIRLALARNLARTFINEKSETLEK